MPTSRRCSWSEAVFAAGTEVVFSRWRGEEQPPTPFLSIYRGSRAPEGAFVLRDEGTVVYSARFHESGWDCGLDERVPVVGFPVYAADNYFKRLLACGYKLAICETSDDARYMRKVKNDIIDSDTGEVLAFGNGNPLAAPPANPDPEKAFEPTAIRRLSDLLGECFILR